MLSCRGNICSSLCERLYGVMDVWGCGEKVKSGKTVYMEIRECVGLI